MTEFNQLFNHLYEYRVIICRTCQYAIVPDQVRAHLAVNHPDIPIQTRKNIQLTIQQMGNLASVNEHVIYPDPQSAIIEGLPIYQDGLSCVSESSKGQQCPYVCRNIRGIQEHCKREHSWVNTQKRGRSSKALREQQPNHQLWIENQNCQRFFVQGKWQRYFKVMQEGQISEGRESIVEQGEQLLDRRIAKIEEEKRKKAIEEPTNQFVVNPWLEHTGWQSHLAGFERQQLHDWFQPAIGERGDGKEHDFEEGEGDVGLAVACRATRRVIRQAMAICNTKKVDRSALHYINRKETGAKSNEEPFDGGYRVNTIRRYSDSWVKLLRYLWRTHRKENRPGYSLTPSQAINIGEMIKLCCEYKEEEGSEGGDATPNLTARARERRRANIKKRRGRIEQACLNFWITMFDHEFKDTEFESGIISGIAVLGSESEGTGWAQGIHFTPKLSAIVTVLRALVVYKAYKKRENEVEHLQKNRANSEVEARRKAKSIFERVQAMVHRFMILVDFGSKPGPIDRIFHMRTYGQRIRYTTHAEGKVAWDSDKILIDKLCFTMDDVRSMIHGLLNDIQTSLFRDLMLLDWSNTGRARAGSTQLPALDLSQLYDNPAERTDGWNFLEDTRNKFSVDGRKWLWRRVLGEDRLQKMFIRHGLEEASNATDIVWNSKSVDNYMAKVRTFKEQLFVLVHMTGGGPARGPEIVSIQHKNGVDDRGYRGVFVEGGLVSFVTSYHKGYRKSKKVKIIHRYVPREVSEIVIYFLWLVEPWIQAIQMLAENQEEFKAFIWEPLPEEGWKVGEDEDEEEEEEEYIEDTNRGDNDVIVGSGSSCDVDEWSDREDDNPDTGDNSRERSRGGNYRSNQGRDQVIIQKSNKSSNPDGFWDNNRVRRVMQAESMERMSNKLSASIWRNAYPAIHRELTRKKDVVETLDLIYENKEASEEAGAGIGIGTGTGTGTSTDIDIRARANQSGHSLEMEEGIYGRAMTESPFHTMAERQKFRSVSTDWHRILGFQSAWKDDKVHPETRKQMQAEQEHEEFERWRMLRKTDLREKLRQIVGPNAEFRGLQERALEAIMQRHMRVLIVMRTGGGKSLFFMLPVASSRDGVTIVIVPLTSLREDLKGRCDKAGIKCAEWHGKRPPRWANMVLVTPESAVSGAFGRFIDEKRMMKQLDRIVIDECHVVLDSTAEWRPQILQLIEMTEKQTQVVYLTATLPPREEPRFFHLAGLDEKEVTIFRDTTSRRNIEYRVRQYPRGKVEQEVEKLVAEKKREYPLPGQIIVYCKMVKQAIKLAEVLGCRVYHRQVGDDDKKREILKQLTTGKEQVFTATNALGLGIDAPTIRVVIHVGIRERMRDYVQESGRAGRDGHKSEAIILQECWTGPDSRGKKEQGFRTEKEMKAFLEGESCRRIALDKEMDGRVGRMGCEIGEERCDICQGKPRGTRRARVMVGNSEDITRTGPRTWTRATTMTPSMTPFMTPTTITTTTTTTTITPKRRAILPDSGLGMLSSSIITQGREWAEEVKGTEEMEDGEEYPSSPPVVFGMAERSIGLGIYTDDDSSNTDSDKDVGEVDSRFNSNKEGSKDREDKIEREEGDKEEQASWQEFQLEKQREEINRQRKIEARMQEMMNLDRLRERFDDWDGICVICKANGRDCSGHSWKDCQVEAMEVKLMTRAAQAIKVVVFDDFSCCRYCWAPQSICHRWAGDMRGTGVFKIRAGEECQYPTVLRDAATAILAFRGGEVEDWIEIEQQKRGLAGRDEWSRLRRWLGLRVKCGRVELSEMCRLFYVFG